MQWHGRGTMEDCKQDGERQQTGWKDRDGTDVSESRCPSKDETIY